MEFLLLMSKNYNKNTVRDQLKPDIGQIDVRSMNKLVIIHKGRYPLLAFRYTEPVIMCSRTPFFIIPGPPILSGDAGSLCTGPFPFSLPHVLPENCK